MRAQREADGRRMSRVLRRLVAAHAEAEELINIGAYAHGSNRDCDVAIALKPRIDQFFRQEIHEKAGYPHSCRGLLELAAAAEQAGAKLARAGEAAGPSPAAADKGRP